MNRSPSISRRKFLIESSAAAVATSVLSATELLAASSAFARLPIASFSKVHQELKLDFEETAAVTAEAGLDGIDCPVRPAGQILPEQAAEDLPRMVEILKRHKLKLHLLTTAISSPATPHTETILRAAAKLGVKYYRLNWWHYKGAPSREQLFREIKAQLKDLAAMNKQLGVCAIYQNHSGGDYVGAKVSDLMEIVGEFDPRHIGIAFDIGHALIEIPDQWRAACEQLKSHFKIAYVKDTKRRGKSCAFGQGDIATTDYFKLLKSWRYHAPISMHTEYDFAGPGNSKTRAGLVAAMRRDAQTLKRWLQTA